MISIFEQFGFVKEKFDGNKHDVGSCPFCRKKGHFYVNVETKAWDCKKCGKGGGFQKFLQFVAEEGREAREKVAELAKMRKLSPENLESMGVGWFDGSWIVPVYAQDGKTVLNIKIYDGNSFKNSVGCSAAIYGLWELPDEYETIYVAEGEWDALAMREMIHDDPRSAVVGVPGAGTVLKPEIVELFIGKSVVLLYDNDPAGKAGARKSVDALLPVAAELKVVRWPETCAQGWDVRDVYTKDKRGDAAAALIWIQQHAETVSIQEGGISTKTEVVGEHVPHTLVYEIFGKWFHLSDSPKHDQKSTDIYDVIFGSVFANRIPGDPLWLYLIAPPGGFKTEPLLALSGGKGIEIHESVTAPALISGQPNTNGVDPSLIPHLNGRLLIVKDWTIILGLPDKERDEILSILRGAFDGVCGRSFGNGIRREFKSTFGIIAAVTPVIEQFTEVSAAVGERFLSWRNWISEDYATRYAHIKRALDNTAHEAEMRREINGVSKRVLLSGFKTLPNCSDEFKDRIIKMAQWIAVMRGTVCRDKYRKNVLYKPFSEVGTRLSKEILKLLLGISIFKGHGSVRPDTMRISTAIAWSSVSTRYAETLKAFLKTPELSASEAEKVVGLPAETMQVVIENLMMLGVLSKGKNMKWNVNRNFINLTKGAGLL